jgi:hypothetical protein
LLGRRVYRGPRGNGCRVHILITNIALLGRSGTEVVTIELARGLASRGHQVAVYAPYVGDPASDLMKHGIVVTDRLDDLPWRPDVIHGHHNIAVIAALARYPNVPALFVMHDARQSLDRVPRTPQIVRIFAVDNINRERHLGQAEPAVDAIDLLPNAVDLDRFRPRDALPERPRRALLLAKNSEHVDAVREASRIAGLQLDEVGSAFGRVVDDLDVRLKDYDLVFATARMALEALAVGCSVIVCDGRGLAGLANLESVDEWRADNFGLKLLTRAPTVEALLFEINRYQAKDAALAGARIRQVASLADHLDRVEAIYRDIVSKWRCSPGDERKHSEAAAIFLATWLRGLDHSTVSGIARDVIAKQAAKIAEQAAILNSRLRLIRRLWHVVFRKLKRSS